MNKLHQLLVFGIFVLLLQVGTVPTMAQSDELINKDGHYNIRIEITQWDMTAYDLYKVEQLMEEGLNETEAMLQAEYRNNLYFEKGANVTLTLVSRDVQHGFTINEMNISIALNRPSAGEEFGNPFIHNTTLPDYDIYMTAFCHIFCGLGHDDDSHKLNFVIGNAQPPGDNMDLPGMAWMVTIFALLSITPLRRKLQRN